VSHVIGATAQYAINTLAPFYQDELGLSRAQVGLFFSAFYLAMTSFSFGAGWLADHLGVQKTMLQGHLFLGVCTVAASLAPSFSWAFASFFLAGAGYSFLNPASSKGVMAWFDHDERATAMGSKQTGVPAGGVGTAMLPPQPVLCLGWRGALVVLWLFYFLFGFFFCLFLCCSAQYCFDYHRFVVVVFHCCFKLHDSRVVAFSSFADSFPFGRLFGRIPRSLLRPDWRTGRQGENRRRAGDDDYDQRRLRDPWHAAVRLPRRSHRLVSHCLAGACRSPWPRHHRACDSTEGTGGRKTT